MDVGTDRSITLEHIEQLIALCPIAIVDVDASQRVRYCNPAFEHLFGYGTGEPLNRTLESLVGVKENDALHLTLQTHRKDQTSLELELDVIPKRGTGRSAGYWGIFQDVTAQRHAEATLSKVTQTMIEAQERERFRIAKELHDDVAQGLTVLGFYHSHPHSDGVPSETDRREVTYTDDVHLIVGLATEPAEARAYRFQDGDFVEVALIAYDDPM